MANRISCGSSLNEGFESHRKQMASTWKGSVLQKFLPVDGPGPRGTHEERLGWVQWLVDRCPLWFPWEGADAGLGFTEGKKGRET